MQIRVFHRTVFRYRSPVVESFNEARLRPVTDDLQTCRSFALQVTPHVTYTEYCDFYVNAVQCFEITTPHTDLIVEARSDVETFYDSRTIPGGTCDLAALHAERARETYYDYLTPSRYVTLGGALRDLTSQILPSGPIHLWADSERINEWIFDHFTYSPRSTHVHSSVEDILHSRQGVCQDYAHLMLAVCRHVGIPARYVSGYFLNDTRSVTATEPEASHAWVEVYIPGFGWRGLDPTHRRAIDERYVKIAVGRDYADIRPLKGTYRGGSSEREMEVEVRITDGNRPAD